MPNNQPRTSAIGDALDKFEKEGPYTLAEAQRLAKLCYKHRKDGIEIGDSLENALEKFSANEWSRLAAYDALVKAIPKEYKEWRDTTTGFSMITVNHNTPYEYLRLMAELDTHAAEFRENVIDQLRTIPLLPDAKMGLLVAFRAQRMTEKAEREASQIKARTERKKKRRDKSPKRQ